ncbi:MAG: response regulator [Clostridia bacterium]|nr:response regulator [Clostridia bacterium]
MSGWWTMATSPSPEAPLRVVVVDDVQAVRETIRAMLELYPEFEVVGEAADGEAAVAVVLDARPDVVLMDVNLPLLDGIRATARLVRETGVRVVMISVENGQEYFRRAMKAGARDFLVKPFSADALAQAVRRAAAPRGDEGGGEGGSLAARRGRIVTVFGAKGGVGVSTVAANLALALASEADPAALVDLELEFGGLEVLLDVAPRLTLADLVREGATSDPELVKRAAENVPGFPVWLVAAPPEPHLAPLVDGEARPVRERPYVREVLDSLTRSFRHVVVDGGHGFREAHIEALEAADVVVFVTTPDVPALAASRRAIAALAEALAIPAERMRVVVNRADEVRGLSREDIRSALGAPVDFVLPVERGWAAQANLGLPFAARRARTRLGDGIQDVARRLVAGG